MLIGFRRCIFIALLTFTTQLLSYQAEDNSTRVFADALVWQLREGGTENWGQEISPAGTVRTINLLTVPFNLQIGLRAGVEKSLKYDFWDSTFAYTFYKSKANTSASVTSGTISSPYLGNFFANNTNGASITTNPTYRNASMQWKFNFNVIDLELGRKFEIDHFLLLRPFIGLKFAVINQKINTTWQNPTNAVNFNTATEDLKQDFWGVGPSFGVNSSWPVYKEPRYTFSLIANVSGAIMWGHWSFSDVYQNNAPTKIAINLSSMDSAATMGRGLLGVEWSGCYSSAKVSLRVGYEAQVWFNHMQFYIYNMGRLNNLMSLQGGVIGLNVNF